MWVVWATIAFANGPDDAAAPEPVVPEWLQRRRLAMGIAAAGVACFVVATAACTRWVPSPRCAKGCAIAC